MATWFRPDRRSAARSSRPGRPNGFTLIEILIVVVIISILGSMVIASVSDFLGTGRAEAVGATVAHVRRVISHRAALPGVPKSANGFPMVFDATWFDRGVYPTHTWTGRPMNIELVNGANADVYPAAKTFDITDPAATNAWYNTTNGEFCVRIADDSGTPAEILELFNTANAGSATALAQTTR